MSTTSSVNEIIENFALFVGSLSAETTQEDLIEYFSKFGGIQGANLITDWATGRLQITKELQKDVRSFSV